MPELEIECPNCGSTTGTGIRLSERGYESTTLDGRRADCDSCGEEIYWDKSDVQNM